MAGASTYAAGTAGRQGNKRLGVNAAGQLRLFGEQGDIYTGQVATRAKIPDQYTTTSKQLMSRSRHRAAVYLTSIQVMFPNWYVNQGVAGETATGGVATIEASVEYPIGTFTRITFSAANQGSIANGGQLLSDAVTVNIPDRAFFFIRSWFSHGTGIPYCNHVTDWTRGEFFVSGATTTNYVMGSEPNTATYVPTSDAKFLYAPCAILGQTSEPSVFIWGDSRQNGYNTVETFYDDSTDIGTIPRCLGPYFAYINASATGDRISFAIAAGGMTNRVALAQYCTHVVDAMGINDVGASATAATILANKQTAWTAFGKPTIGTTLPPVSTSTDVFVTVLNQTTAATNAARTGLNDLIRKMPTGMKSYWDIADSVESARNSGKWATGVRGSLTGAVNTIQTYALTSDGIHETDDSTRAARRSFVVDPLAIAR